LPLSRQMRFVMRGATPLLIISIILYNLLTFGERITLGTNFAGMDPILAQHFGFTMFSGDVWNFSIGDGFILISLIFLFVEAVKATRTTSVEILGLSLDMAAFVVALVEFIVLKGFGTSTFFLITVMCLFSVMAGFTISIVAAKRDIGTSGEIIGTH